MLNATENTKAFLTDMRKLGRRPKSSADRHKYANRNVPSSVEKLYNGNTDDFDPIPENREHLLHTLVPLIYSIARNIAGKFGDRIELDDCINSGMIGAALATDRYIAKSAIEQQPAKLSSYAYAYIEKYVNEHCRSTNSLVSHGTTEWISAGKTFVNSGNALVGDSDGKKVEMFDIVQCDALRTRVDDEYQERIERATKYATKLFNDIDKEERKIIMMYFGISMTAKTPKQIAKHFDSRITTIEKRVTSIIEKMKQNITDENEISDVIATLSGLNITKLIK